MARQWQFDSSLPIKRARRLSSYETFDEVLQLARTPTILNFSWEAFCDARLRGCSRAAFLLEVSTDTYDAFFNSPAGYRGQYALSVAHGEAANRAFFALQGEHLLAFALKNSEISVDRLRASLGATDAKVWIYEPEVERQLGRDVREIIFFPWQQASEGGVGLLAPVGTKLEIKGGWIDPHGAERRDPIKAERSDEIHRLGYS